MAIKMTGNMLEHYKEAHHVLVCAGSAIRRETKELVMMSGLGYELSQLHTGAAKAFGEKVLDACGDAGIYWLICQGKFGVFQNQILPRNGAHMGVISGSVKKLSEMANANPDKKYYLEAMNGNDPVFTCDPWLRLLPDNVYVWFP